MQKIIIIKAENGYLLKYFTEEGSEYLVHEHLDNDNIPEVESMAAALNMINELVGPMTSRYSEKRIKVSIEPGDKFNSEKDE